MKCFYRRFTIFGDKEGEMYTSDIYKEVTAVGKKKLFDTVSGYFLFQERGNSIIALFSSIFSPEAIVCRFISGRVSQLHSSSRGTLAVPLGVSMALANFELILEINNLSVEIFVKYFSSFTCEFKINYLTPRLKF